MSSEERKYQAMDDLRTLTRAQEIQADRSRMAAVKSHAASQVKTLQAVTGSPKPAAKPRAKGK
jgi:hypothetical protein